MPDREEPIPSDIEERAGFPAKSRETTVPSPGESPVFPPSVADWEHLHGFRETLLLHFPPNRAAALRLVGYVLYDLVAEAGLIYDPGPGRSCLQHELRAVLVDLRHLQGFLAELASYPLRRSLDPQDLSLALLAGELAGALERVADALQTGLQERAPSSGAGTASP